MERSGTDARVWTKWIFCGPVSDMTRDLFCRYIWQSLLVLVFVSLTAWISTAGAPAQMAPQSTEEGHHLFESSCAGCHGLDGRGGERGPDISTRPQVVQLSDRELLDILRGGRPTAGMPPFEFLGNAKLNGLLAYLRSLQGKGSAASLPGDPQAGKTLFFGKARCSECHMVQGTGGFLGRDLSLYGAALSPKDIHTDIVQSGNNPTKANKTAIITMRDSQKFTGVIRNEDNFSIQLQSFDGTFHFLTRADVAHLDFLPEPIMPANYDKTLTPAELNDLVSYLATVSKIDRNKKNSNEEEDN